MPGEVVDANTTLCWLVGWPLGGWAAIIFDVHRDPWENDPILTINIYIYIFIFQMGGSTTTQILMCVFGLRFFVGGVL